MSRTCIISAQHDYRSLRKVNLHFIAQELASHGPVRFFSCRFSNLSRFKSSDPRLNLFAKANRLEVKDGIECYLWKTFVHPVSLPRGLGSAEAVAFRTYVAHAPEILRRWIVDSDVILIESGIAIVFFDLVRSLNPSAKILYIASDGLDTIKAAHYARDYLRSIHGELDGIVLPSLQLKPHFPNAKALAVVPHGIDAAPFAADVPSPYPPGTRNAVSIGSMLFDPRFFEIAAPMFPDVTFHVIGSGQPAPSDPRPNVRYHAEASFLDTIPYLKHADFGIAPYRQDEVPPYLADTSMKLMQFAYLGLPAVCPLAAVGAHLMRFGYDLHDAETVRSAVDQALAATHRAVGALTWADVTQKILSLAQDPHCGAPHWPKAV
jgi:2-beta-glucuronyltransferase